MPIKRNDYATRLKDTYSNKRVIGSTVYPKIEKKDSDIYVIIRVQDKYYGTPNLWWVLAQANQLGEGSFIIESGTKLRIPQDIGSILNELERINRER